MKRTFEIDHREEYLPEELKYWKQFGIGLEILTKYKVKPVSAYSYPSPGGVGSLQTVRSNDKRLIFSYEADPGRCYKLYQPYSNGQFPKFSWLGNKPPGFIFGKVQLPQRGSEVYITGGEKDVLTLSSLGKYAISLNSETSNPDKELINELKSRFDDVIVLYDLDETGQTQSIRICREYGLKRFILPTELGQKGGKDISDLIKLGLTFNDKACEVVDPSPPIQRNQLSSNLSLLIASQAKIRENKKKVINFANPILRRDEDPVIFPRTINVLQGKAGVHKSRLAETICSAFLRKPGAETELLGFQAQSTNVVVCYVDTERNTSDQLPYALQQIQRLAGYSIEEDPENFDYISVIEISRDRRFEAISEYLAYVRQKFTNHQFIVLDVTTDCIEDFNRSSESMKLIDLMNQAINEFDVTFLCIIHENPGNGEKARGHLGTEIINKASTVIQVGFEKGSNNQPSDVIAVKYLKCRNSRIHEPFYLQFDQQAKHLVLADPEIVNDVVFSRQQKAPLEDLVEDLKTLLTEPMSNAEVVKQLVTDYNCSDKIIRERLKLLIETKTQLLNGKGQTCTLVKKRQGREIIYALIPEEEK